MPLQAPTMRLSSLDGDVNLVGNMTLFPAPSGQLEVVAGGQISKAAAETEWGGYSGYVADPDGNLWELAHNPGWPLDERGLPQLA